ncbi:MAG: translocation/assembly module TamB domain-containing protein, partial [Terracidiphilus sp.]
MIATAEREATKSLGVRVELQNFAVHPGTLSLDLYGITAAGASPYVNPPLLQIDHVQIGIGILSVLHRKWYLSSVEIDHPVAWIFVDKNGASNLPVFKSSGNSGTNTSVFDLGIRHALLSRGEVFYNNRPSAMAADLRDLSLRTSFNDELQKYSGELDYSHGQISSGEIHSIDHTLDVQFDATPNTFHLAKAQLTSGASRILLSGTLTNYNDPVVDARYDAVVDGDQVGKLMQDPSMPAGLVRYTGSIHYHKVANETFLQALRMQGELTGHHLSFKTVTTHTQIDRIAAQYNLENGDAALRDCHASLLGGEVTAQGTMKSIGSNTARSQFDGALRGISLSAVKQALARSASNLDVTVTGTLNATATAQWGKTTDDLVATTDATLDGQVARLSAERQPTSSVSGNASADSSHPSIVPLDGVVHATYTNQSHQFGLKGSSFRTAHTNLGMNGTIGRQSRLNLDLQAGDLREVATIVDLFRAPTPGESTQPLDLAGTASFQGSIQGSTVAPRLTGQLTAANLHFNGSDWKTLRTGIDAGPDHARLQHAELVPATRGSIQLDARAVLKNWRFTNQNPVQIDLHASQMNIADLQKIAGSQLPIAGTLNANVRLHGTELRPQGNGDLALTGVTAYEQPIQSIKASFSGSANQAQAKLTIHSTAGDVDGKVTFQPDQKSYRAELTSTGIHLDQLESVKTQNLGASGVVALHATGQGTFDNPQLTADVQIPNLIVASQTFSGLKLQVNLANHVADALLTSAALNTNIQAKARVHVGGDYLTDASLDTEIVPLQPLLAVYAPDQAQNLSGQTEVHATLHGPLKTPKLLEAHVTIPTLKLAYQNNIQLAAASPIQVNYKNGVVDVPSAEIRGTDTDLKLQTTIPMDRTAPMSLLLQGTVDLQLAQLFSPDVRSAGQLKFNIDSRGAIGGANLGGEIDVIDASFASNEYPVGLQHGNGVLTLTTNRLNIAKFEGVVGGGTVTAQGGVVYRPNIQFDMGLAAKDVRLLYPEGMRENLDANLRFHGTPTAAALGGTVGLSNLSFTPAFDLNSLIDQFSGGIAPPPSLGFSQNVALNIAVNSTNNVDLVSRTLSVNGSANLQVRGTAADPVLLGRVNLTGGDMILNGNRFVLAGGTVQFANPSETRPVVNLTLNTNIQQYNIHLRFNGPVEQMRSEYSSDPALPTADIINLLAFGQTTEASANNPTPANQAAESLVASQVSSQLTSRISKVAGISQLSVSPVLAGSSSQGPPGANLTIQQRVTGNLFVTFSTNVASTQSQTIQGQYQVSPRVAVSATR